MASCVFVATAGEIPEKAERYRTMLLKKPENPVLFGRMLDAWLEQGELEGLKGELELRAKDGGAADWRLLAVFHEHAGDETAALKALDEAIKRAPDEPTARLARGKALGTALRFEEALKDLEVAGREKTLAVEAGTLRGKYLARAGRSADAVKAWQELIAANPADEGLKEDLIELEIGEGMLPEAVAAARELAAATDDPYQKALRGLRVAEILAQGGKKEEALKEYRTVFAVSAEASWLEREVLARVSALFGREDDAAGLNTFLGELREAYPRRVVVKKEAAKSLLTAGQEAEAVAMFREVLKVMPGNREVREEFIAMMEGAGRNQDAAAEIAALLETAKADGALWERLASLKKAMNDAAGSEEALGKAIALMPGDESGAVARAALWERFGKTAEAEGVLREAMKAHGHGGEAAEALAGLLVTHDQPEEAVALWREMAADADREGLLRIARSLAAHGRAADAAAILQPRMKDFPDDPLLLAAICQAAQLTDNADAAVPQALSLVRQAQSPTDLETALKLAGALVARSKEPRQWLEQLAAKPDLSLQERCLLSDLYEVLGDSIQAERVLKDAMAGDASLLAASQRVRLLEVRGDANGAVAAMRELLALPGGMKTAHVKRLVDLLQRAGDDQAALAATAEWQRLAPGDKLVWTKRAELLLGDGRPAEAVGELRRALAKFGGDEDLRAKLADAQREAGMNDEAWRSFMSLYDEAEASSAKVKWAASLARVAQTEGTEEELVKDFRRRSRDNPSSAVPLLALAEMYHEWQNPEEEMNCLAEAARRKPEDGTLGMRIADLYEQQGTPEKAEAVLRGMLGGPNALEARRRLSAFWIRQGETERGLREMLEGGGKSDPRQIERMVMVLATAKDWDNALKILEPQVRSQPDDWRLAYFQAVVLTEAGRKQEAFDRFVTLLSAKGEVKGATSTIAQANRYMGAPAAQAGPAAPTRRAMPAFRRWPSYALSHRGNQEQYYGTRSQRGEVILPATLDEVHLLSLAQVLDLARGEKEGRDAMLAKVQSTELDDLAVLKQVYFLDAEGLKAQLAKDDAPAEAFRWYLENLSYEERVDVAVLSRGIRLMAEKQPEVAFLLASRLQDYGEPQLRPEEATLLLDVVEKADEKDRNSMVRFLGSITFAGKSQPEELRQRAEKLLMAEIERDPKSQMAVWLKSSLPLEWMRRGRFDQAVEWLNKFSPAGDDPQNVRNSNPNLSYLMRGMQLRGGQEQEIPFVQMLSTMLPQAFQGLAQNEQPDDRYREAQRKLSQLLNVPENTERKVDPIDLEGLTKVIPQVKNPKLRMLFWKMAGKEPEIAAEIDKLIAAPAVDAADLLLAAAYRSEEKKPEEAYALIVKASELPSPGGWRDRIDGQLVKLAVGMADAGKTGAELDPARRAVLRMRRMAAADPSSKAQLAQLMTKLGLEEESQRFTAAPVASIRGNRYSGSGYSSRRTSTNNAISALIREGKKEAAARALLIEIRRVEADNNRRYELDQLYRTIANAKLKELVLKFSEPGAGASFNRRKEYALRQLKLDDPKGALPLLRELAAEKPDDVEVRTALFSALPPAEQEGQLDQLVTGEFRPEALSDFFEKWISDSKPERHFAALEAMTVLLEKMPPVFDASRNLSWVNYQVKAVTERSAFDKPVRPLLSGESKPDSPDEELSKRREVAVARLYRAMLLHPQTAEQGFILLHATRVALGTPPEELDRAALKAQQTTFRLQTLSNDRQQSHYYMNPRYRWAKFSGNGSTMSGNAPPDGLTPQVYLSHRSADGVKLDLFDESLIGAIRKDGGAAAETFNDCLKVVETPGSEAFEQFKNSLSDLKKDASTPMIWLYQLARARDRGDLLEGIETFTCDRMVQGRGGSERLYQVLSMIVGTGRTPAERTAAVERISARLLGPREAWPLYVEVRNRGYMSTVGYRMNAFQAFSSTLSEDFASAVAMARFVAQNNLAPLAGIDGDFASAAFQEGGGGFRKMVEAGLFAPGPAPTGAIRQDGTQSMLADIVTSLKNRNSDLKADELLKVEGDDRLWARLTGAAIAGNSTLAAEEIELGLGEISKWDADSRQRFSRLITGWFPDIGTKTKGETAKLLAENLTKAKEEVRERVEKLLKDGLPADLQPWSSEDPTQNLVVELVDSEPVMAAQLWAKCLESFRKNSQNWGSSSGGFQIPADGYAHGELLESMVRRKIPLTGMAGFIAELEKDPAVSRSLSARPDSSLRYMLRGRFEEERKTRKDAIEADPELAKLPAGPRSQLGVLALLGAETPPAGRPILGALAICYALRDGEDSGSTKNGRPEVLAWIGSRLKEVDPTLADAATIFYLFRDVSNLDDAAKAELRRAVTAFAAAPAVPSDLKITVLSSLLTPALRPILGEGECAKAMAGAMAGYLEPGRPWASDEIVKFLTDLVALPSLTDEDLAQIGQRLSATTVNYATNSSTTDARVAMSSLELSLAVRGRDPEGIAKAVKQAGLAARGRLDLVVKLWEVGKADSAVLLLPRPGEFHQNAGTLFGEVKEPKVAPPKFTRAMEAALPGWLKTIDDSAQRYRMECTISCLQDAEGEQAPEVKHDARLTALMGRFAAEGPRPRAARMETLAALANAATEAKVLQKDIEEAARGSDFGKLLLMRNNQNGSPPPALLDEAAVIEVLIRRWMRYALEESTDAAPFLKQVEAVIGAGGGDNKWASRQMMGTFFNWYASLLTRRIVELPPAERPARLEVVRKICEAGLGFEDDYCQYVTVGFAIATHAAGGEGAALDKWLAGLPAASKEAYDNARRNYGLRNSIATLKAWPLTAGEFTAPRRALLTALLSEPATVAREIKHPTEISSLLDSGVFTQEDIVATIDGLPTDHPQRAPFLAEKAGIIGWRSDDREAALKGYAEAEAAAKAKGDAKQIAYVASYHAAYLENRLNQVPEAAEIARGIDLNLLEQKERQWMENILKKDAEKK